MKEREQKTDHLDAVERVLDVGLPREGTELPARDATADELKQVEGGASLTTSSSILSRSFGSRVSPRLVNPRWIAKI